MNRLIFIALMRAMFATIAPIGSVGSTSIHTVFSVECSPYLDWQSVALAASHYRVGQPGPLTRFLACDEENLKTYNYRELPGMKTFVHRNAARLDPDDYYTAYNKPFSIGSWLNETIVEEEWILFIDSDMLFLETVTPEDFIDEDLQPGTAIGGFFDYLTAGVNNTAVASRFVPDPSLRDLIAKVGAWVLMHRSDMEKVAPNWLEITKQVRTAGPDIWSNLGDKFVTAENPKSWICEMYGYVFGTALSGVRQIEKDGVMIYPGWVPQSNPRILHYGIRMEIGPEFMWDKHSWGEDMLQCPTKKMPTPPSRSSFSGLPKEEFQKMELMIETLEMINEAITGYADKVCSPSNAHEYSLNSNALEDCVDKHDMCSSWADAGECDANAEFMMSECRQSCKNCIQNNGFQRDSGAVGTVVIGNQRKSDYEKSDYGKGDYGKGDYGRNHVAFSDETADNSSDLLAVDDDYLANVKASQRKGDYSDIKADYSVRIIHAKTIADVSQNQAISGGERDSYNSVHVNAQPVNNLEDENAERSGSRFVAFTGSGLAVTFFVAVGCVLVAHRRRTQLRSKHHKKVLLQKY